MAAFITAVPAYGRDYKSGKEVQEAWDANKDFRIEEMFHPDDGRMVNKQDAEKYSKGTTFNIRYKRLTQIKPIKVK